ncbi:Transcription initiation protein spt3 [Ceratobasidium sp. 370]|nr:Transcription initiation protein spt3 [Ceratobasidium sp. 370]
MVMAWGQRSKRVNLDEATIEPRKIPVKLSWDIVTVYSEVLGVGVNTKDEDKDRDEVEAHEDSIARLRDANVKYSHVFLSPLRLLMPPNHPAEHFREFVNLPAYLNIEPNDNTIDILGFLTFEMVRALSMGRLAVKCTLEESYQAVEITGAKCKAPSSSNPGVEPPVKQRWSLSPESGGTWGSILGSLLCLPPPEARRALWPAHIQEAFAKMQQDRAHQHGSGMRNWRGGLV